MSKKEKELEQEVTETEEISAEETAPETDPKDEEIAKLKDQLMRNMAEYDNYRKRTAKERTELTPEITARVAGEFLPVLDNLERALAAETSDEKYKEGVKLIHDSFMATLDKLGVEKVQTEDFDPAVHQAVQQVESDLESGKIVSVFQNGYKIGTKILRFAMVTVAQ
ncbi:MAG: nucleotide exchange factor GrpE [Ruminiclostridium sp.]|nr:nucleotide exchange factor GrpE [Ruminiclostridium sp.]